MIVLLLVAELSLEAQIQRLEHPRADVREHACRVLRAAGDRAVPALLAALQTGGPETRRAAAGLLGGCYRRSLKGARRCDPYVIPGNKQTQSLRRYPAQHAQYFLSHPRFLGHYRRFFTGVLEKWEKPSAADYSVLLETLAGHVRKTLEQESMLMSVFAVDAIVARLDTLAEPEHWTVRWAVSRRLIPEIAAAVAARGRRLSDVERDIYQRLLRRFDPSCCDANARALHRWLRKSLSHNP